MADPFSGSQAILNYNKASPPAHNLTGDWLAEILDEVGLTQFHSKLTNDLQLTRLSHFDFVSEDDLINIGMSRPASKRLLASIRKKKSLVTAIKNKIVNKLLPLTNATRKSSSPTLAGKSTSSSSSRSSSPTSLSFLNAHYTNKNKQNRDSGQLTCLINTQDVQIKEQIGHGVHGVVKKGVWTAPNGRCIEVALKILKNDILPPPKAPKAIDSFSDFVKEINVMHKLNHPNLIKLFGVVLSTPMMMVTELAPFGNVRDKLRKENGHTAISLLINFGVQIASGMEYLESKRLVHRDLATRNIFVSHNRKIKIGDFGLMRAIPHQEEHYIMNETTRIPFPWCAPESLKLKVFSSASDTFMYAVTMWEMFSFGKEPWAALSGSEILTRLDNGERLVQPPACPPTIYQIMLQCWDTEPSNRPTFSALTNYISTSYPLEVKAIRSLTIENSGQFYPPLNPSANVAEDLVSVSTDKKPAETRKILKCEIDDHILVIDGQPENYWWKGQNQRTFDIGWFPLNITQWIAPKKAKHYISKPLKNSFIHTGHSGPDGTWGDPRSIDQMYLKNPLAPPFPSSDTEDQLPIVKLKSRSKLSRLFGINEPSSTNSGQQLSDQKSYHKLFNDNSTRTSKRKLFHNIQRSQSQDIPTKGKGKDNSSQSKVFRDEPPLIDFSDELQTESANNKNSIAPPIPSGLPIGGLQPSKSHESLHRHLSDTNLQMFGDRYYNVSLTGSWNTGTFDDAYSGSNNYSKYYCPQDAVVASPENEAYHYYSAVPYGAGGANVTSDSSSMISSSLPSQDSQFNGNSSFANNVNSNVTTTNTTTTIANIAAMSNNHSHQPENTLSHHSFPVTFDDPSLEEASATNNSIRSNVTDINNTNKKPLDLFNSRSIINTNNHQQQTDSNINDEQQQQKTSYSLNENYISTTPFQNTATSTLTEQQSKNENISDPDHSIRLSKDFIRTLEDELGISPGRSPSRNVANFGTSGKGGQSSNSSKACVVSLPPPPSIHGHSKVSQVAIVAPNMLATKYNDTNRGHLMNDIPSSREQRLVNIIQKRCSGDISAQTCLEALRRNNLDHELAVREIQVNRLMSLQITKDRNRCERALIATNWKLESAASRLLDETL